MYSSTSPYYGMPAARAADGPYGALPPARPVSRASSHTATPMPMPARPISRAASPAPPGMIRPTDIRGSASTDFQIEKAPKSPGPYGRPSMPQHDEHNRNEQMFRQQVTALIAATGQQIIASGRVPAGPTPLVLFFRTKNGVSHCLDFPVDTGHSNPPTLDVLIAACKSYPKTDFSNYGDRDALFFPENLSFTPSFEIANHLILGSVHASLYPQLPLGNHVFAVRNRLDVINSGSHLANHNPALLSNDGRSATIIVTLPVRFRGGDLVVRDSRGHEERFQRLGEQAGNIDWLAFPADCEYRIETVQKGCCLTLSYGVYLKHFNPSAGAISDALIIPSDGFFDLLAPILNMSRGRSIALFLNYDYIANPAEVTANSLVPQLKGVDLLVYNAFKLHKLSPELHWTAGGYIWPADRTLEDFGDDIQSSNPMPNYNSQEFDAIRSRVEASGAVSLLKANITVLSDWSNLNVAPVKGEQRVYFVSNGELEKLVLNVLVVIYVP